MSMTKSDAYQDSGSSPPALEVDEQGNPKTWPDGSPYRVTPLPDPVRWYAVCGELYARMDRKPTRTPVRSRKGLARGSGCHSVWWD